MVEKEGILWERDSSARAFFIFMQINYTRLAKILINN
jgi:hypothetical protein